MGKGCVVIHVSAVYRIPMASGGRSFSLLARRYAARIGGTTFQRLSRPYQVSIPTR
jgi:hypothetical protein